MTVSQDQPVDPVLGQPPIQNIRVYSRDIFTSVLAYYRKLNDSLQSDPFPYKFLKQ